jgi:hypothetical protein
MPLAAPNCSGDFSTLNKRNNTSIIPSNSGLVVTVKSDSLKSCPYKFLILAIMVLSIWYSSFFIYQQFTKTISFIHNYLSISDIILRIQRENIYIVQGFNAP